MANQWTKEQKQAIEASRANILVSASAGSGKTAVLVERIIHEVIDEHVDIDRILAVTFTQASAKELKERLVEAIEVKLIEENISSTERFFLKRQLMLLHRASITTIDSFCLELVRKNFQILEIDPNISVCESTQAVILKNKAMTKVLEAKYTEVTQESNLSVGLYAMLELFAGKEEEFIEFLLRMYQYIQSFEYPRVWLEEKLKKYDVSADEVSDLCQTEFGFEIYQEVIENFSLWIKKIEQFRENIATHEEFKKQVLLMDEELQMLKVCAYTSNDCDGKNSWEKLYQNMQCISFKNKPSYRGENKELNEEIKSFIDEYRTQIKEYMQIVYADTKTILKDNQGAYAYIKYTKDLLDTFDEYYQKEKQKANVIDFFDIEHLALKLLVTKGEDNKNHPTELAISLQDKYFEVYTDEYQDTSFIQEAILEAVSGSKNRFMVGDIKQSIYKFRQAMPEIFNEKYNTYNIFDETEQEKSNRVVSGEKKEKIILAQNFRSRRQVLESINYIFKRIMSKEVGDCEYSNLEVLKVGATWLKECEGVDYTTEVNIIDLQKERKVNILQEENNAETVDNVLDEMKSLEVESLFIARKIKSLLQNFKVLDKKTNQHRRVEYKDIVILLRNMKSKGNVVEETLKNEGIPAYCDYSVNLFDGDELRLMESFLKVIDNPYQDIHMVAIMYSIIGNFDLNEIAKIRLQDKKAPIYRALQLMQKALEEKEELTQQENIIKRKIDYFISLLEQLKQDAKIYSISELCIRIYQETNLYEQFAMTENSEMKKANLDVLIDFAKNFEKGSNKTLSSFILYLDTLKSSKEDTATEAKILGENENVVRIMTIHKSKGLEFPVVILADTAREYSKREYSKPILLHHHLGVGINIVKTDDMISYPSLIKQAIKYQSIRENRSEELRMLYVALTRAKEKLIIFATVNQLEKVDKHMTLLYDGNTLDKSVVAGNTSFFKNIYMTLKMYQEEKNEGLFHLEVIPAKESLIEEKEESTGKEVSNINYQEIVNVMKKDKNIKEKNLIEKKEKLKQFLEETYPYLIETQSQNRISVSALKQEENDKIAYALIKEEAEPIKTNNKELRLPNCLIENKDSYTPVRKGSLVHFILEYLDFKLLNTKEQVEEYLQKMVAEGVIEKEDCKYINSNKIEKLLHSKIGKELKEAIEIHREEEFLIKDINISHSMIQGVIDLYYISKNKEIILVDFKTDRMLDKQYYLKHYQKQLMIYRTAIEKLLNVTVSHTYIYSFALDQEIEVPRGDVNE